MSSSCTGLCHPLGFKERDAEPHLVYKERDAIAGNYLFNHY